jgi:RNAse (barnase) inhibitor barstar
MNSFIYFTDEFPALHDLNGIIFSVPKKIQSKNKLLSYFNHELKFPYYFGENLDALYDCLVDLSWIKEKKLCIIHNDIPLDTSEVETAKYLTLLSDVAIFWGNKDGRKVNILFPEKCKNKIEKLLIKNAKIN